MLVSVQRRICNLEKSIRLPLTAERFLARVAEDTQRTGSAFEVAVQSLIGSVTDDELDRLTSELEVIAFGRDTVARDAARHRASVLVGNPDLFLPATSQLSSLDNGANW